MKTHETVMNWVTGELASGRLRIGDRLPGERALAETLQVSRGSLREALRVLEALGTIRTSTGSGPQAGTIVTAAPEQALTLALDLQLATSQVDYRHISEVRLLLETWAASRADEAAAAPAVPSPDTAAPRTDSRGSVWDDAERFLALMGEPGVSVEEFLALDASFHAALSRAAGNPLISTLMEALRSSIADHTLARARALPDWDRTAARLHAEHRGILAALRGGERERASRLLRAHIEGYYAETEG